MKIFAAIVAVCIGTATAMPQMGGTFDATGAMGAATGAMGAASGAMGAATGAMGAATGAMGAATGGLAWGNTRDWGPKAYGPGLNNPWAVPVNPFQMESMLNLAETSPHLLVRADVDGELSFTNKFGMEVDHPLEDLFEH